MFLTVIIFKAVIIFKIVLGLTHKAEYFFNFLCSKTVLGSHVVEQLLFSMFPSFLTFNFYLNLGSFFTFRGPNGLFLGSG